MGKPTGKIARAQHPKLISLISASVCLVVSSPLFADSSNSDLQQKVDNLQKQVQQLSAGLGNNNNSNEGLPMHGFIDVRALTDSDENAKRGFALGNVDFYLTPQLNHNVKALVELNFEVGDGTVNTDLERMQLGYQQANWITIWGGRFHTPYGYWHDAFHHGAQIQTSIYRPVFLDFEDAGGILPAHAVGLWAHGTTKAAGGTFTYDFYGANSPRLSVADTKADDTTATATLNPDLDGTTNHNFIYGTNISYGFKGALNGLIVGIHGLGGNVNNDSDAAPTKTKLNMNGLWAAYLENDFEVLAEYYHFNNKNLIGGTDSHSSNAGYIQIGYGINNFEPYIRYEKTELDQADNYFAEQISGGSYKRAAIGFKYDIDPKASFKLEADKNEKTDRDKLKNHLITIQYAVRF